MITKSLVLCLIIVIYQLLSINADDLSFLECGSFILKSKKFPLWHVGTANGYLIGKNGPVEPSGTFTFERIFQNQPYFYIRFRMGVWDSRYAFMSDRILRPVESSRWKPGMQGQWKVSRVSDGQFTFSPMIWPNLVMCMKDNVVGTIVGCSNNSGSSGTFTITAA